MHFQLKNKQTKLIHVVRGKILDVVVNLKSNSKILVKKVIFFLKKVTYCLFQKFYAHGYECLTKKCIVFYIIWKSIEIQKNESGIPFDDKKLKIKWKTKNPIISKEICHIIVLRYLKKLLKDYNYHKG